MANTRAGAPYLDVAAGGVPLVAQAVLIGDRADADIGDDFRVGMGCGRKLDWAAISSSFHTRIGPQLILAGSM